MSNVWTSMKDFDKKCVNVDSIRTNLNKDKDLGPQKLFQVGVLKDF